MHNMISHATSHLVRRAPAELPEGLGAQMQAILEQMPAWGSLIFFLSILVTFVSVFLLVYTLALIFTLACVEAPQNAIAIPNIQRGGAPPAYKDTDPLTGEEITTEDEDPEVVLMQPKPITSSIRNSVRHLISIGGPLARWRGFWFSIVISVCTILLSGLLGFLTPFISGIIARIVLSRWEMAWTHIIISNPSPHPWWRRMPPFKTWKKIWAPTAIAAVASQAAALVPFILLITFQMTNVDQEQTELSAFDFLRWFSFVLVWIGMFVLVVIPAECALIRVQCSMLPEGEETIIPVDRTFGDRVVSEADGGSGKLSFRDAWSSIDREARRRLVKLVIKMVLFVLAFYALTVVLFTIEGVFILVPAMNRARNGDAPSDDMRLH